MLQAVDPGQLSAPGNCELHRYIPHDEVPRNRAARPHQGSRRKGAADGPHRAAARRLGDSIRGADGAATAATRLQELLSPAYQR